MRCPVTWRTAELADPLDDYGQTEVLQAGNICELVNVVFMEVNFNCSADGNHTWNLLINDALLSQEPLPVATCQ